MLHWLLSLYNDKNFVANNRSDVSPAISGYLDGIVPQWFFYNFLCLEGHDDPLGLNFGGQNLF